MSQDMFLGALPSVFAKAVELRNNQTPSELILWEYLRLKPKGFKFRRQHPIKFYIADFYCHVLKLIIEVDGNVHDVIEVQQNDLERQNHLEFEGVSFLRFTNDEIENDLANVKNRIEEVLISPVDSPLPYRVT